MGRTSTPFVLVAVVLGLASGCGDAAFDPETVQHEETTAAENLGEAESALTREEMVNVVLWYAHSKIGAEYQYGAVGPDVFDCSGLTRWVFLNIGVDLAYNSALQWNQGYHWNDMVDVWPADLVFFGHDGVISHVGIYVGNGQYIHAASEEKGVELQVFPPPAGYKPYIGHARYF